MQNIALAKKINFTDGESANESIISIEPLFPGYGMTLGNSLRRVLLSSLPGAAVVGVKIKGASHEFMSLPHIKEDVLELVLNIKQLHIKMFEETEVKLELNIKGKKTITAADIKSESKVEIKNPDLVIGTITDEAGSLDAEIFVQTGLGYRTTEASDKENKEIGYIEIDSIFSPVTLVSIDVENTRVGKMTNWDKLNLRVKTDGTISTKEAFEQSVKILVDQFSVFTKILNGESVEEKAEEIVEAETEEMEVELEVEDEEKEEKKEKKVKKVKKEKK